MDIIYLLVLWLPWWGGLKGQSECMFKMFSGNLKKRKKTRNKKWRLDIIFKQFEPKINSNDIITWMSHTHFLS